MKEITAYQCNYCKKHYLHKSSAKRHENKCFLNPNNKACLTCGNFVHLSNTVYVPPYDGNPGSADYDEIAHYCNATNKKFGEPYEIGKQEFQKNCKKWMPIKCGRDCDNCKIDCVLDGATTT